MNKIIVGAIDALVPFGALLRYSADLRPYERWKEIFWRFLPQTFFAYWVFSLVPVIGGLLYMLALVPLSLAICQRQKFAGRTEFARELLIYYTVILIGFGSVWSFVGHTFMADQVATGIGWQTRSPFQAELAFYALGTGIAGLLAVWLRGHLITALVIVKSVFWYGAAYVHISDMLGHQNYSPLNVGAPLLGDVIYPTLLLTLLVKTYQPG